MFKVKNWQRHQHYKFRNPPWIKLHKDLLNDPDWFALEPEAAKVLIMLWLIASENNGVLPASNVLAFRLHLASTKLEQIIKSKLSAWIIWDASSVLATCYQDASTERELELDIIKKEKNTKKEKMDLKPDEISQAVWDDYTLLRKNKKAPITATVIKTMKAEAAKAGWSLEAAMAECCARGWQGFKADWVEKQKTTQEPTVDAERKTYEWHKKLLARGESGQGFNIEPEYKLREAIASYEARHLRIN